MRCRWATFGAALALAAGCAGSSPGTSETPSVPPVATGQSAPAVDLPQLPAVGIAVTRRDGVDFYSLAGKRLGRVRNASLVASGFVRHPWVLLPTKRLVQLPTWRATTAGPPRVIEATRAGCVVTDRRGALTARVCRGGAGSLRTTLSVLR